MSAFLSTLSLRRATAYFFYVAKANNFYPRSPCGERLKAPKVTRHMRKISIHALLAESDIARDIVLPHILLFLSTLSLRRATQSTYAKLPRDLIISIHALLAESDNNGGGVSAVYFISIHALLAESDEGVPVVFFGNNPFLSTLSLRRATPNTSIIILDEYQFLSTLSLRRATAKGSTVGGAREISIHALLAESDIMTPNYIPRMP